VSIRDLIDANVECTNCGTKGVGNCECWHKCPACGWSKLRDELDSTGRCAGGCFKGPPRVIAAGRVPLAGPSVQRRRR
jgi:hypothetical protein